MIGDLEEEDVDVAIGHDLASVAAAVATSAASGHGE